MEPTVHFPGVISPKVIILFDTIGSLNLHLSPLLVYVKLWKIVEIRDYIKFHFMNFIFYEFEIKGRIVIALPIFAESSIIFTIIYMEILFREFLQYIEKIH